MIGWNQKFLDYEIETIHQHTDNKIIQVGIKSFSITRLKLNILLVGIVSRLQIDLFAFLYHSWNQKFLDYEIET